MNGAITWETLAYMIPVVGAIGGLWWRLNKQIADERESRLLAFHSLKSQMSTFELDVARTYATHDSISKVVDAVNRLGERLDRFLEFERSRNQQ